MKNFDEIYKKICEENATTFNLQDKTLKSQKEALNKKQMKKTLTLLFSIASIILFFLLILLKDYIENFPTILLFIIMLSPILSIYLLSRSSPLDTKKAQSEDPYSKTYKETIISSLIKNYDPNLQFNTISGITKNTYNNAEFYSGYYFSSDDHIYGKLDETITIKISDILTANENNSIIFQGLFSIIYLPNNIESTILIRKDYAPIQSLKEDMEVLFMDSQEFEDYFDIFTNNKNMAMRILTADTMQFMVNFKVQNNVNFEVTLKNNFAYIQLPCNNMFEVNLKKDPLNYDTLLKYYKYLDFMCELNKKIYNNIKEKNL